MARTASWNVGEIKHGVVEVELSSWRYFHDYVMQEMLDFPHYFWRGQRDSAWGLQTSFDRAMQFRPKASYAAKARTHLANFKMASRGRRGLVPAQIKDENDWWALAQHHGLATPLLDWTESAFAALYFAFDKEQAPASESRAVFAMGGLTKKNREISTSHSGSDAPPLLEIIRPLQDENSRLVSQSGLFTKTPYGHTVESWVKEHFKEDGTYMTLIKILIPNRDRPDCLKMLSKMNINHASLFPDLYGAGEHCNKRLQIDGY
jgi:hypothetical protein